MADPFLAEIRIFGFTFAPQNWAQCNGQSMPISQNTALFSLIGVTYGGNGTTVFSLPNLQGSTACSSGQLPGSPNHPLGQAFGSPSVTVLTAQIPYHNHNFNATSPTAAQETNTPVANSSLGRTSGQFDFTSTGNHDTTLAPQMIGMTGGSQPHENRQPFLVLNYCICMAGIYPPRP